MTVYVFKVTKFITLRRTTANQSTPTISPPAPLPRNFQIRLELVRIMDQVIADIPPFLLSRLCILRLPGWFRQTELFNKIQTTLPLRREDNGIQYC